jgi:hypothetical protein
MSDDRVAPMVAHDIPSDAVDAACDRFEAAWKAALGGSPRPR